MRTGIGSGIKKLDYKRIVLSVTAIGALMAAVAPFSGTLADRVGARFPATIGVMIGGLALVAAFFAFVRGKENRDRV